MDDRNENDYEENKDYFEDGEYHFVRPSQNLYEDAEFVPCSEETEVPSFYAPSEKAPKEKPKKSKKLKRAVRIVCLCLVCAIVGGIVGAGVVYEVLDKNFNISISPPNENKPISSGGSSETHNTTPTNGSAIYNLGCAQAVGVSTEVTTTNWFGQTSSSAVSGSGFIVTSDGYIVTNYHVVEYAVKSKQKVTVMFYDGSSKKASIVGYEESNDIAVIKVDATGLTPVTVGDSDEIMVCDEVYAIGNPLGELAFSMTTGHISALDRSIVTDKESPAINMFQFDAAVNPGNSGGPLYNANGEVIGVVTAKYSSTGIEGLSFAIPINDAIDIANDLITNGYVTGKAYLGAYIDNRYTSVYAEYYGMPEGAYVYNVENGSCAEKAGMTAGDIITKVGDKDIKSYSDLSSAVRKFKAGDTTDIVVYRMNSYLTLSVTFDEAKPNTESSEQDIFGIPNYQEFTA